MNKLQSFAEFWDFYVLEHSDKRTRFFHLCGTLTGAMILICLIAFGYWYLFPLALVPSYGLAWYSHFFIEHNKPATFKYPLWSLIGDYKMVWMMLRGKMDGEVHRIQKLQEK